jgi:glucose dehydrogenase
MSPMSFRQPLRNRRHGQHPRRVVRLLLIAIAASLVIAGCGLSGDEDGVPAFSADQLTALPEQDWITNGGTVFNQRYSPLDQLTPSNVSELKGVWRIQLASATEAKYSGEAQPIVHDGVAYVSTGASDVFALDVQTGETIWKYDGNLEDEI